MSTKDRLFLARDANNTLLIPSGNNAWGILPTGSTGPISQYSEGFTVVDNKYTLTGGSTGGNLFKVDLSADIDAIKWPVDIDFQWRLNGATGPPATGTTRGMYVESKQTGTLTVFEVMSLKTGDYLEPYLRNNSKSAFPLNSLCVNISSAVSDVNTGFGTGHFVLEFDDVTGVSSSTTIITTITLTSPSLEPGTYRIAWQFKGSNSSKNTQGGYDIKNVGTSIFAPHGQYVVSTAGGHEYIRSGFKNLTFSGGGTEDFVMEFASTGGTGVVNLYHFAIEGFRIS